MNEDAQQVSINENHEGGRSPVRARQHDNDQEGGYCPCREIRRRYAHRRCRPNRHADQHGKDRQPNADSRRDGLAGSLAAATCVL